MLDFFNNEIIHPNGNILLDNRELRVRFEDKPIVDEEEVVLKFNNRRR